MWDKLAKQVTDRIVNASVEARKRGFHGFTGFELETMVKEEIEKFVAENIVKCYFKCDAEVAKNAKGGD
jgi:hypothetical protein